MDGDPLISCNKNNTQQTVTSVGNSWVVCRSKSHNGRIYYFNTFTGKAAWNLSDSEIEKAKQRTKAMGIQSGASIEGCAEPTEPPGDINHGRSSQNPRIRSAPRIYNKQIINNQFTKPYPIPFANPPCGWTPQNPPNEMNVNLPVASVYNSNVWSTPPTHQFFIAPVAAPITEQNSEMLILQSIPNMSVQNYTVPLSNRFHVLNQLAYNNSRTIGKDHSNYVQQRNHPYIQRNFDNSVKNDLRERLFYKRKIHNDKFIQNHNSKEPIIEKQEIKQQAADNITEDMLYESDVDNEWLEENKIKKLSSHTNLIDMSSIWKLSNSDANLEYWFIVPDVIVLLNHFTFLNCAIQSDERCRLIVPMEVLKFIRSLTCCSSSRVAMRARRATRFITQQMNKIPEDQKRKLLQNDNIPGCCYDLIENAYHVILLTEDKMLLGQDSLNSFTVQQFKNFLHKNSMKNSGQEKVMISVDSKNNSNKGLICDEKSPKSFECVVDIVSTSNVSSGTSKEIEIQTDVVTSTAKKTANACVQTDFELTETPVTNNTERHISSFLQLKSSCAQTNVSKEQVNTAPKRREIRLKRSLPAQSFNSDKIEKKQFKWRRRKPATADQGTNVASSNIDYTKDQNASNKMSSILSPDLISHSDNAIDNEESMASSDFSVKIVKNVDERIIIEETSTSGVISNSVDSGCAFNINQKALLSQSTDTQKDGFVMFKVTNSHMDEYLRTGCEEWVSRFVQIMEEAMTQVLNRNLATLDPRLPPPWTIHEASECIKMTFSNDINVIDSSNKLSNILFKISDGRGQIRALLKPAEFMEMYSCGVYLIKTLQTAVADCEDLRIAEDSLSKLLADIENPNTDISHCVFIDSYNENSDKVPAPVTDISFINAFKEIESSKKISPRQKESQPQIDCSPRQYTTRSNRKNSNEKGVVEKNKCIRNIDIQESFFSTIHLQKNGRTEKGIFRNIMNTSSESHTLRGTANTYLEGTDTSINENDKIKEGPKIIRNFNKCFEFEEKLKNKIQYDDNSCTKEYDFDFAKDERISGSDFYVDNGHNSEEYDIKSPETDKLYENQICKVNVDGDTLFKWFVERSTCQVHEALVEVRKFCQDMFKELAGTKIMTLDRKTDLLQKSEKVNQYINSMIDHMKCIIARQSKITKSDVGEMMKHFGITDYNLDDDQEVEYKNTVAVYMDQAKILAKSMDLILTAIKHKK